MTDPGLTNRLRQRSRRAGLAVGLSMALTIAVCIGGFAWIYAKANPYFLDFVGADATSTPRTTQAPPEAASGGDAPTEEEQSDPDPTETPEPEPTEEQEPTAAPTATSAEFAVTHISNPDLSTNLRPGPSVDGDPVDVLPPGTGLQYLGEQQTGDDGFQWYHFRTEDGTEGWMREGTFQEAT
jgi:hypothetical protein